MTAQTPEQAAGDELNGHVTVRFPAGMAAAVKQIAAAQGMTVSAWIRREVEREAARREQPAPELAAAMAETRKVREILALALSRFIQSGNGWKASVRVVELARWYDQAGIPRPQELRGVR